MIRLLLFLLFLILAMPAGADEFLSTMNNVPLAPGLKEIQENGSVLEGPLGPITIAYAKGDASADKIKDYYRQALPSLGWEDQGDDNWRRGHELLKLDFVGKGKDPVVVVFTLHKGPA